MEIIAKRLSVTKKAYIFLAVLGAVYRFRNVEDGKEAQKKLLDIIIENRAIEGRLNGSDCIQKKEQ